MPSGRQPPTLALRAGLPSGAKPITSTRALWLIPLAAFLAVLPLILHGNSCGHDQVFHIQGWLDAAQQLRHGHYPRWSPTSAWNAGEPRFLFYPPLSWLLGALLTLIFPAALTPTVFVFIALVLAGLTFHRLASHFAAPNAALIASALYLANPYMLFNAFERTAYAELLAAAWIPLLLLAILRPRPTLRGTALPIALLWLTNAPAAVMGCYALALLATLRLTLALITTQKLSSRPEAAGRGGETRNPLTPPAPFSPPATTQPPPSAQDLAFTYIAGTLLGLALPAFYLIPAAYERRFVQVTMAIIPGMRPQDNFLFAHTADAGHNGVNLQISLLALTLIALTFAALIALLLRELRKNPGAPFIARPHRDRDGLTTLSPTPQNSDLSTGAPKTQSSVLSTAGRSPQWRDLQLPQHLPLTLTFLAAVITFLLTPPSTFLWLYVPDLAFLQLPWRLLTLLTPVLALTIALLLSKESGAPFMTRSHRGMGRVTTLPTAHTLNPSPPGAPCLRSHRMSGMATIFTLTAALLLPLALGFAAFHPYAQFCHADELPATIAQNLATHHGFPPTDEYTPTAADNDILRTDNPAFWLFPNLPNGQPANPNTPAPNTTPTASELDPTLDNDDTPVPLPQTLSTEAPHHLTLSLPQPATLVLNLRDYPNWVITNERTPDLPNHLERDDGLLTIPLPAGPSTLDITWHRTPDQTLGLAISALALIALALTFRHRSV
jgi:hypothetical protein